MKQSGYIHKHILFSVEFQIYPLLSQKEILA